MSGLIFLALIVALLVAIWATAKRGGRESRFQPEGVAPLVAGAVFVGLGLAVGLGPDATVYVAATILLTGVGGFLVTVGVVTLIVNAFPAPPWRR